MKVIQNNLSKHALELKERGLVLDVNDQSELENFLLNVNPFRVNGYLRYFQKDPTDPKSSFQPGTSFKTLVSIYETDSEFRQLLLSGLAIFETTLKSRFAYLSSHYMDAYAYIYEDSYRSVGKNLITPNSIVDQIMMKLFDSKSAEVRKRTISFERVPVWVAVDSLSLTNISIMYKYLNNPDVRWQIAKSFELKNPALTESTIRSLATLRNACAHNAQIWNKSTAYPPPVLNKLKVEPNLDIYNSTPWALVTTLNFLVDQIKRNETYSTGVANFLKNNWTYEKGLKYPMSIS